MCLFLDKAFGLLTIAMVVSLIVTFLVVSGNSLCIRDKKFAAWYFFERLTYICLAFNGLKVLHQIFNNHRLLNVYRVE